MKNYINYILTSVIFFQFVALNSSSQWTTFTQQKSSKSYEDQQIAQKRQTAFSQALTNFQQSLNGALSKISGDPAATINSNISNFSTIYPDLKSRLSTIATDINNIISTLQTIAANVSNVIPSSSTQLESNITQINSDLANAQLAISNLNSWANNITPSINEIQTAITQIPTAIQSYQQALQQINTIQ